MEGSANIRIEIDPSCREPEVIIRTNKRSAEIENIIHAIEQSLDSAHPRIPVFRDEAMSMVGQRDIFRIYTETRRLVVCTNTGVYESRSTLREIEELLDPGRFVRISRFEIINLEKTSSFDFSMSGTIKVTFGDGSSTWVSRRYVRTIQQVLSGSAAAKEVKL